MSSHKHDHSDEQERKIFVSSFNKLTTDEEQLKTYFEQYGNIVDCTILRDRERRSRGCAFILFGDTVAVDDIMHEKKNGKVFSVDGEMQVKIKRALPKGSWEPNNDSSTRGRIHETSTHQKIFVGGLPSMITEDELKQYFGYFGTVSQVQLLRDSVTNRPRGFAFVSFEDEDSADKCIQRRSHVICKKTCEVKRAHQKSDAEKGDNFREYSSGVNPDNNRSRYSTDNAQQQSHLLQPSINNGNDVNSLIQQAFLMGQQSAYAQPILQHVSVPNLSGAGLSTPVLQQPLNNILLQALANQQAVAPVMPPPFMVPPPAALAAPANTVTGTNSTVTQLAQLLQRGAVNTDVLGALLNAQQPASITPGGTNNVYSNPSSDRSNRETYDSSRNSYQSRHEDTKRSRYRPY